MCIRDRLRLILIEGSIAPGSGRCSCPIIFLKKVFTFVSNNYRKRL
jgi:hypothetical protein